MADGDTKSYDSVVDKNWRRYIYVRDRGHTQYVSVAQRNDQMYLGQQGDGLTSWGGQWADGDRKALRDGGNRPAYEFNEIMPAVNTALGYQIQNRLEVQFAPRGGRATAESASNLSKVIKYIADENKFRWLETQVLADGLIEQRGYFDIRMDFDENFKGKVVIDTLDPRDVIPDPDAKSYDPKKWADVIIARWLTLDEIGQLWGEAAKNSVESSGEQPAATAYEDDEADRNRFGDRQPEVGDATLKTKECIRYRVIERQYWVREMTRVAVNVETGDIYVAEGATPEQLTEWQEAGLVFTKRIHRRVRWCVTTASTTLHDDWSPYDRFTVIPFFPIFRRGKTRGIVDAAVDPQQVLNKAISQNVHIVNTTANSGWVVAENSLANMDTDELEKQGAKTGLVLVYKGQLEPKKIQANSVPLGIDKLIERSTTAVRDATVPQAMRGIQGGEISGLALQSRQHASQTQLALPMDNLSQTRHLVFDFIKTLVQTFFDAPQVFVITEKDKLTGRPMEAELAVNQYDSVTDTFLNDLTVGEYDIAINEVPLQATFENSQFEQAMEMKKIGVAIPDRFIIQHSNLAEKYDILDAMQDTPTQSPLDEAKTEQQLANVELTKAKTTQVKTQSIFEGTQAAQLVATIPQVAPVTDQLLASAGFVDADPAPIIAPPPAGIAGTVPPPEVSTDPNSPAKPASGLEGIGKGIETPRADSVRETPSGKEK